MTQAIKIRCRLNIYRLYPDYRQANLALGGTDEEKAEFHAWVNANKAHMQHLIDTGAEGDAIDEGWPCPHTFKDYDPPEDIADLFDASLTARQNHDRLTAKYAEYMGEFARWHGYGDHESSVKAAEYLKKAERIESGIRWNRAVHAEVI